LADNNGMKMAGRYPAVPLNELLFLTYGAAHSDRGSIRPPLKPGVRLQGRSHD